MRTGACVQAVGVLTGWGEGVTALPADAREAATAHPVIRLTRPPLEGERFRRATRECLLGVAAVQQMLREAGLERSAIAGPRTALLFVTAGAYGASNVEFIAGRAGTLHFPYTAPSALSAEVAIEFGLTGAHAILIGGPATTVDALWQAGRLLRDGRCDRALVLAVETFDECEICGGGRAGPSRRPWWKPRCARCSCPRRVTPPRQAAGRTRGWKPRCRRGPEARWRADRSSPWRWRGRPAWRRRASAGPGAASGHGRLDDERASSRPALTNARAGGPCNTKKCSTTSRRSSSRG